MPSGTLSFDVPRNEMLSTAALLIWCWLRRKPVEMRVNAKRLTVNVPAGQ